MSRRRALAAIVPPLVLATLFASAERAPDPVELTLNSNWFRCGGPFGGLGYDVRMHPLSPDTMFVTDSFAGAFRSFDGGANWHPINQGIDIFGGESGDAVKVFCLTVDPNNPSTIWIGLQDYRGIYKSTDMGESWTLKVNGITETTGLSFRGFTIDPYDPDIVYAAGELSSYAWAGSLITGVEFDKTMGVVYKTLDGGNNWTRIWRGDNLARYVWIDPRDTGVLYVSTGILDREAANSDSSTSDPGGVGILKSYDGGASWTTVNNGLDNLYIGTLFMHPRDPDILIAGADGAPYITGTGVYRTDNAGALWTKVLDQPTNSVEFSLSDSIIAYAGGSARVHRSEDGGLTFFEVTNNTGVWGPTGVEAGFPIDFQVDPRDPARVFTNNYGGGNFLSTNGGSDWTVASKGYTGAHVRDLAVAQDNPARVYAAVRTGFFVSANLGEDWECRVIEPATGVEWNAVAVNPLNAFHVLGGNMYTRMILATYDGAETWHDAGAILPPGNAWRCFAFAPSDTQTIYAGAGGVHSAGRFNNIQDSMGIFKSTDGGASWVPANDSLSQHANVAELAVLNENPNTVWAACSNQRILKTMNGGGDWYDLSMGLPAVGALSIAIDPLDSTHVFAGFDDAGLWEWYDTAGTWRSVPVGLPFEADVTDIAFCPTDPLLVYIGDQRSGVYRSTDGGETWVTVNNGLRMRAVNALAFSGDGQVLYAGTEGEGVFRLDGAGPATATVNPGPSRSIGGLANYPNPFNPGTTISYTAPRGTHVRITIYDVSGRRVRVLVDRRAGFTGRHATVWDGRDSRGHKVASGVYFCRLDAVGRTETRKLVLIR